MIGQSVLIDFATFILMFATLSCESARRTGMNYLLIVSTVTISARADIPKSGVYLCR